MRDSVIRWFSQWWLCSQELMVWRLRLYCGHTIERTAHRTHLTVHAAFSGSVRCTECGATRRRSLTREQLAWLRSRRAPNQLPLRGNLHGQHPNAGSRNSKQRSRGCAASKRARQFLTWH